VLAAVVGPQPAQDDRLLGAEFRVRPAHDRDAVAFLPEDPAGCAAEG
jgi:hypothetical protein